MTPPGRVEWPTTTWWWSSLVIHPGKRSKFSSDRHLAAVSTWTAVAPSKLIDLRTAISRQNWTWMDHGWSYKGHKNTKVRKETNCSLNIWSQKLRMGLSWKNCHPFAKNRGILLRGHCLISCWPLIHCDVQDMFVQVHWSLSLCKRFHVLLVIPIADVFLPLVILFVSHPQHEIIDFDWLPWPKTLWFPGPPMWPLKRRPLPSPCDQLPLITAWSSWSCCSSENKRRLWQWQVKIKMYLKITVHVYHIIVLWQHYLFFRNHSLLSQVSWNTPKSGSKIHNLGRASVLNFTSLSSICLPLIWADSQS